MVWNFDLPEMPAGPVMELHGARKRFHVPQGLKPLLEEMSLEVLREQPDNIYEFLADYLRRKVSSVEEEEEEDEEEETLKANESEKKTYLMEDGATVTMDEYGIIMDAEGNTLERGGLKLFTKSGTEVLATDLKDDTTEEANLYATKIQAAFRGHLVRKRKDTKEDEEGVENYMTEDGKAITMTPSGALVDAEGQRIPAGTKLKSAKGKVVTVNSAGKIVVEKEEEKVKQEWDGTEAEDSVEEQGLSQGEEWQSSEEEWSGQNLSGIDDAPAAATKFSEELKTVETGGEINAAPPLDFANSQTPVTFQENFEE